MNTVYVLKNVEGRLYIGQTANLEQRLVEHSTGLSRWTKSRGPWSLVHQEHFETRAEAMKRERTLKSGRAHSDLREKLGIMKNAPSEDEALS